MLRNYEKYFNRVFVLIDSVTLAGSFVLAYYIKFKTGWFGYEPHLPLKDYLLLSLAFIPFVLIINYFSKIYSSQGGKAFFDEHLKVIKANLIALFIIMSSLFFIKQIHFSRALLLIYFASNIILMSFDRLILRIALNIASSSGFNKKYVLVIGAGPLGIAFIEKVRENKGSGFDVIGFLDDDENKLNDIIEGVKVLGSTDSLNQLIPTAQIDQVVIALPLRAYDKLQFIIETCENAHIKTLIIPDYFRYLPAKPYIEDFDGIPLVEVWHIPLDNMLNYWFKRAFDLVLSSFFIIIFSPILLITTLAIKLDSAGSIIFKQKRIGRNGKTFAMFKFRSMVSNAEKLVDGLIDLNEADGVLFKIKDDPRITKVGKIIRRTSIDELPQLFNVIKGDMSIVGPRPPLPKEVEMYQEFQNLRLRSIPGITGLWQVSGRSNVPFEEMVRLDLFYIENQSFWLDIKILFKTIPAVLRRDGAY